MDKTRELRFTSTEVRSDGAGGALAGYAAVFNQWSEDLQGFRERILPGAFTRCLASNPDVHALFNHDSNLILGRTKSGTLKLAQDHIGLRFECILSNSPVAQSVREAVRRGDVDQCSFGFTCQEDRWPAPDRRELLDVDLYDVSPVTFAAYPQTSLTARSLWPDGVPAELRSHMTSEKISGCYDKSSAQLLQEITRKLEEWEREQPRTFNMG